MADFINFDRARAKAYFAEFINEMEPGLERLRSLSETTEGPSAAELDLSPASLDPLWDWARTRFAWRDGYVPPPDTATPGPKIGEIEPLEHLPSWFHRPNGMGYERFSLDTLWLIDGLGRYLGETAVRAIPGLSWEIGHSRVKHYQFQNHPVIGGLPEASQPFAALSVSVSRTLNPGPRPAASLEMILDEWRSAASCA